MKRNHWLDFLKLTFIIVIAFWHTVWWTNLRYGFLPVEFFFIVSGYYVYASYLKQKRFGTFVTSKIKRLLPTYLVILQLYIAYSLNFPQFYANSSYEHYNLSLAREVFLLQSVGLTEIFNITTINIVQSAWYVSVYFYGAIMLYWILTHLPKKWATYIISATVAGVYGFYIFLWDGTLEIWTYKSIFYMPLWRGLAGMSVGILLGMIMRNEHINNWIGTHKVYFNILGIAALAGAFYSFFSPTDIEWVGVICFVYILANAVSPNGLGSFINDRKYANLIPDISLEILLLHKLLIPVSVKIADTLGVLNIDALKYIIYATVVLTVSYIFNKFIIPMVKKTVISMISLMLPAPR